VVGAPTPHLAEQMKARPRARAPSLHYRDARMLPTRRRGRERGGGSAHWTPHVADSMEESSGRFGPVYFSGRQFEDGDSTISVILLCAIAFAVGFLVRVAAMLSRAPAVST
jgi:hypothetical protein